MFVLPQVRAVRPARTTLRRIELAPSLSHVIDRLIEDAAAVPAPADRVRSPALDVDETDRAYLLKLDLPGVAREQLKVTIEGRRVSVETIDAEVAAQSDTAAAEATPEPAPAGATVALRALYRERSAPRYARTVSLPKEVSSDEAEARLEHGVLTLRLPKRVADGARRLTIG